MTLVDTSVWVQHLRHTDEPLAAMLRASVVVVHPWVIGELALGSIARRSEFLHLLTAMPQAPRVSDADMRALVERRRLHARGLGWVDVQLLASALLGRHGLYTRDRRLAAVADELGVPSSVTAHQA